MPFEITNSCTYSNNPQPAQKLSLVAVYLVERLFYIDTATLQLDMHQRKTVHQYGNVITIGARSVLDFVLVDDLQRIVVDIAFVEQINIFDRSVVACQQLDEILLNNGGFIDDARIGIGNTTCKETRPLRVGEGIVVQFLQLQPQVGDQFGFGMNRQIVVSLSGQQVDKGAFEFRLRLVLFFGAVFGLIVAYDRTFGVFSYKVVFYHLLCA